MASLEEVKSAAREIIRLLNEYPYWPNDEREVDRVVYAYLTGHFGRASRQWPVTFTGGTRGRIDFRIGGNNPVVVELVVRTARGGNLSVSGNRDELGKLSRVPATEARVRVLLLLDLRYDVVDFDRLKAGYTEYYLGRGRFERQPVSVIYANQLEQHRFIWSPFR